MNQSGPANQEKHLVRLGITGGIGSGKSVVCDCLSRLGVMVVSADQLARNAVMPGKPAFDKIVRHFGRGVLSENGTLDRQKLRRLISEDHDKKVALERFVHPEVFSQLSELSAELQKKGESLIAVEVPLLFETGMSSLFDYVLTVTVPLDLRTQRVMDRDHVTREEALALMGIQMPDAEKVNQSDFVIENNGTMEDLRKMTDAFHKELMKRIKRRHPDEIIKKNG